MRGQGGGQVVGVVGEAAWVVDGGSGCCGGAF